MENKCNMTVLVEEGKKDIHGCGEKAVWQHPRWPAGIYCEEHKKHLEFFFPSGWTRIKED